MQKVKFIGKKNFYNILQQRVEQYFLEKNISPKGDWRMFTKSGVILFWLIASYISLVFFVNSLLGMLLFIPLFAWALAAVGFCIQHDGNHDSYSNHKILNILAGYTINLIGSSRFLWRQKHNVLHHTYTNINKLDSDIALEGFMRLTPEQKWYWWHRYQHWYASFLYCFTTLSWLFYNDLKWFWEGHIEGHKLPKRTYKNVLVFISSKLFYVTYMFIIPCLFHPIWLVLIAFLLVEVILGATITFVFQLAHIVEDTTFPVPENDYIIKKEWAIHQVETTANFAPKNKVVSWFLGGLNFQIEHHLFSKVCHIHYFEIWHIVKDICDELDIKYIYYNSVWQALKAHFGHLKKMGSPPTFA